MRFASAPHSNKSAGFGRVLLSAYSGVYLLPIYAVWSAGKTILVLRVWGGICLSQPLAVISNTMSELRDFLVGRLAHLDTLQASPDVLAGYFLSLLGNAETAAQACVCARVCGCVLCVHACGSQYCVRVRVCVRLFCVRE